MAYETAAEKVQMRIADALERIASAVEESNYRAGAQERAQLATTVANQETQNSAITEDEITYYSTHGMNAKGSSVAAVFDGAQDANSFTLPNLPTNEA